jgi:hypothetical protein
MIIAVKGQQKSVDEANVSIARLPEVHGVESVEKLSVPRNAEGKGFDIIETAKEANHVL